MIILECFALNIFDEALFELIVSKCLKVVLSKYFLKDL